MKSANRFRFLSYLFVILSLGGAVTGCGEKKMAQSAQVKPASAYFSIKVGNKVVRMQIAALTSEMERGLMERTNIPADEGMVFIYQTPQRENFYMRNTPTPLDVGYFSPDGVLREVYKMFPYDESTISSRSDQLQFALEMNQGWFSQNDVHPGAQLDVKALVTALKERGLDPKAYGLRQQDESAK